MLKVLILGSSSATPAFKRFPSAQIVSHNERFYLLDCGEGAQLQLLKYKIRLHRLDAIFISHLHGDHFFGLPGLLSTLNMQERTAPLTVYGPEGLREIIELQFKLSESTIRYPLDFRVLTPQDFGTVIFESRTLEVISIPLKHRIFCSGFLLREKPKKRKFMLSEAIRYEVPKEYFTLLKLGNSVTLPDERIIVPEMVLGKEDPSESYAYCSDTQYSEEIKQYIYQVDLLYHEATFMEAHLERAKATAHSTGKQAATIASLSEVRKLIIGHFSARYPDLEPLLVEARSVFANTDLAIEGCVFETNGNS